MSPSVMMIFFVHCQHFGQSFYSYKHLSSFLVHTLPSKRVDSMSPSYASILPPSIMDMVGIR